MYSLLDMEYKHINKQLIIIIHTPIHRTQATDKQPTPSLDEKVQVDNEQPLWKWSSQASHGLPLHTHPHLSFEGSRCQHVLPLQQPVFKWEIDNREPLKQYKRTGGERRTTQVWRVNLIHSFKYKMSTLTFKLLMNTPTTIQVSPTHILLKFIGQHKRIRCKVFNTSRIVDVLCFSEHEQRKTVGYGRKERNEGKWGIWVSHCAERIIREYLRLLLAGYFKIWGNSRLDTGSRKACADQPLKIIFYLQAV